LETIGSTNDYVKAHHRELVDFCYVQTDRQTAGRGRLGREWVDQGGAALFSVLLKSHLQPAMADQVPLVAAMAVHKTVSNYLMNAQIKWPNDIVLDGRKLAGILVEAIFEGERLEALIVGIGINVNNLVFPPELEGQAISMRMKTGREHKIENIVDEVVKVFALEFIHLLKGKSDMWTTETSIPLSSENGFPSVKETKSGKEKL
jgi:BirA family biotin operon repressor/biotin-[acetyl-CoA-carboxylase] ligase